MGCSLQPGQEPLLGAEPWAQRAGGREALGLETLRDEWTVDEDLGGAGIDGSDTV